METVILSNKCPSIYKKIKKRFGVDWDAGIIICYAPVVYCKEDLIRFPEKIVHESVHLEQQGKDPEKWWDRYMRDKEFRLGEEVDAYGQEVRWIMKNVKDRNRRMKMINRIALDLSSPMYGSIISQSDALSLFMNIKV